MSAKHRVQAGANAARATLTRQRIEYHLGVTTTMNNEGIAPGPAVWAIYFDAPPDVDLDFLRPDVLPPK